jgi:hypothetical protein
MRDVADKPVLGGYQRFDPFRHVIKITAEVRDLIALHNGRLSHASGKVSVSQLPRCFTELSDGCRFGALTTTNLPRRKTAAMRRNWPGFGRKMAVMSEFAEEDCAFHWARRHSAPALCLSATALFAFRPNPWRAARFVYRESTTRPESSHLQ